MAAGGPPGKNTVSQRQTVAQDRGKAAKDKSDNEGQHGIERVPEDRHDRLSGRAAADVQCRSVAVSFKIPNGLVPKA
jgi:hypothetical protein